jgi:hypothetical protein
VKIQHDGAPAHTSKAFKERWEDLIISLVLEGILPHALKATLITQPANSPDVNLNDNGFFNAFEARQRRYALANAKELIDIVLKVWEAYPTNKINPMWLSLQANLNEIMEHHGGNDYAIPHLSKEKLERLGLLPTVLQVSPRTIGLLEDMDHPEYDQEEEAKDLEDDESLAAFIAERMEDYLAACIATEELEWLKEN